MTTDANAPASEAAGQAVAEVRGLPSGVLIGAIALLVVLVSLPRFRAHVLSSNREDAQLALVILAPVVFEQQWPEKLRVTDDAPDLSHVVDLTPALAHRFPDARSLEASSGLLHHGYRIDTGFVHDGPLHRPALVAWPDDYGRSGDAAYAITADGTVYAHPNGGLWSGSGRTLALVDLSDESWVVRLR